MKKKRPEGHGYFSSKPNTGSTTGLSWTKNKSYKERKQNLRDAWATGDDEDRARDR